MTNKTFSPGYLYPDGIGIWVDEPQESENLMPMSDDNLKEFNINTLPQKLADNDELRTIINEQARTIAALTTERDQQAARIKELEAALKLMIAKFYGVADTDSEFGAIESSRRALGLIK